MAGKVYGIDLGTTNSSIAVCDGEDVEIIKNDQGSDVTPSVVFFTGGTNGAGGDEVLVGEDAKNSAAMDPQNVVQFIKRSMGDPHFFYTSPSEREYRPEEISALILHKIVQDAELYEGEGAVKDVVITVPAYFDDARRTATRQAGKIAGLNVMRVLNEPTAAAIAFGLDKGQSGKVLVYDLGGGTFDVTIMQIEGKTFEVIATGGDSRLGGVDFDAVMQKLIMGQLDEQGCVIPEDDDEALADIREKAERMKIQLSSLGNARYAFNIDRKTYRVAVSREAFERASEALMNRTEILLEDVLTSSGLTWGDINHVLAVGGSSRMPMVKAQLEHLSGKKVTYKVNPDTAVAQGAAIFASSLAAGINGDADAHTSPAREATGIAAGLSISDVTSQSLGVITDDPRDSTKEVNTIVIPHNTKIPCKKAGEFCTVADNQTRIKVEVTEGDDEDPKYVRVIGTSTVEIPPYPKGAPVKIEYAYDPDQTIQVEVTDMTSGRSLGAFEVERVANLSDEQVARATSVIGRATVD